MDNYTNSQTWSKDLGTDPEISFFLNDHFEAHLHEYAPKDGMYRGNFGNKTHTFKIMTYNDWTGFKHLLLCDFLDNSINVVVVKEDDSFEARDNNNCTSETISWRYDDAGDEDGRAGRIARWFIKKLNSDDSNELIRVFPLLVNHFIGDKLSLQDLNTLWANFTK